MSKKAWVVLALGVIGGLTLISIAIFELFFTAKEGKIFQPPIPVEEDYSREFNEVFQISQQALNLNDQIAGKTGGDKERATDATRQKLRERKEKLIGLMKKDPNLAWQIIYPPEILQQFPKELQDELEQEITIKAEINVTHQDDFERGISKFFYDLNIPGQAQPLPLYIAGTAPAVLSGSEVEVHGYKLEENILASAQGGTVTVLKSAKPEALGEQRTLGILVSFSNSGKPSISKREAKNLIFRGRVQDFLNENSYGKTRLKGEVTDWISLPKEARALPGEEECAYSEILSETYPFIKDKFNLKDYDRLIFLINAPDNKDDCYFNGRGYVGKGHYPLGTVDHKISITWVPISDEFGRGFSDRRNQINPSLSDAEFALSHELGHNLGLYHANSWDCDGAIISGSSCKHHEYGNKFDVMGYGVYALHFNASYKEKLGWLSSLVINKPGTYSLEPLENDKGVRLAKIENPKNKSTPFYLEYRQGIGFDSYLNTERFAADQNGLLINWLVSGAEVSFSRLLDANLSEGNLYALPQGGQTFEDLGRGIKIGPVRSADSKKIVFDVGFFKATECKRFPPELIKGAYDFTVSPGERIVAGFSVANRDGSGCDSSQFEIFMAPPEGWTGSLEGKNSRRITIKLNTESDPALIRYEVAVPKNAKLGNDFIRVSVTNLSSYLEKGINIDLKVVKPGTSDVGGVGAPPAPKAPEPEKAPAPPKEPSTPTEPTKEPAAAAPGTGQEQGEEVGLGIGGLIGNFYAWALGIGALIALLVLIYGGIVYTISAGNESRIGEAKEWVFGAVIGLFLLFGSYLILNTINPELLKFKDIALEKNNPAEPQKTSQGTPTTAPSGNSQLTNENIFLPPPLPASLSGGCNSCTDISAIPGIIIKNNKLANIEIARKLAILVNLTKGNSRVAWRVTEAFPPTTRHVDQCHYNGTCVDTALLDNPPTCAQVDELERLQQQAGFRVVNEYAACGGRVYSTTTGGNLHLE